MKCLCSGNFEEEAESEPDAALLEGITVDEHEVLKGFLPAYRKVILGLPKAFWPTAGKNGKHSYTVAVFGKGRLEVLLRAKAFKPKMDSKGNALKSGQILSCMHCAAGSPRDKPF